MMKKGLVFLLTLLLVLATIGMPVASKTAKATSAVQQFYAEDYRVVNGVVNNDDETLQAVMKAALAVSNAPVEVILEANRTYRLASERTDSWPYFTLNTINDFTFEGNGATLLMARPVNSFFGINNSTNITIQDIVLDYDELPYTQGTIVAIDPTNHTFDLAIANGYPLPVLSNIDPNHWPSSDFGVLYDATQPRPKFTGARSYSLISAVNDLGNRTYRVTLNPTYQDDINHYAVNDRFLLKLRFNRYISNGSSKTGSINSIGLSRSQNVHLTNITMYASLYMGVQAAESENGLVIDGLKELRKPGSDRLASTTSDGIHINDSRTGVVIENSTVENTLDDILNIGAEAYQISTIYGSNDFAGNFADKVRVNDNLQFYDLSKGNYIGTATVTNVPSTGRIVIDQPLLQGVAAADLSHIFVFNLSASGNGYTIRNNTFRNGARFGILARAHGGLIENNVIDHNAHAAIWLNPEFGSFKEGPISSDITIRGNTITDNQNLAANANMSNSTTSSRLVSNLVLEQNKIRPWSTMALSLGAVQGITMTENYLDMSEVSNAVTDPAVGITNSAAIAIDGLCIKDPRTSVTQDLQVTNSDQTGMVQQNVHTDLAVTNEPFSICKKAPDLVLDDFEQGTDGWTGSPGFTATSVSTMVNTPSKPYHGQFLLEWAPTSLSPANAWRTVTKSYAVPLNLSATPIFRTEFDSYGYAGTGMDYEAMLEFKSGTDTFSQMIPVQVGRWSTLAVDLSGWSHVNAITQISISFRIANLSTGWLGRHQIDYVGADKKIF